MAEAVSHTQDEQAIRTAVEAVFDDFDAGRFAEVAERLTPETQMADELTGGWLRGVDHVTPYLLALRTACSDVHSPVSSVRAWWVDPTIGAATFMVHQSYRLDGEPREELLAGTALFRFDGRQPELALLHLGPTARQVTA